MEVNEPMLKFAHWINHNIRNRRRTIHGRLHKLCAYLVWICWWRILLARWWHDDAVRASILSRTTQFLSFPGYTLMLIRRQSVTLINYSSSGWQWKKKLISDWRRRPGRGREEKEKKKNKNQYSRNAVEKSGTSRGGRKTWGRRINKPNTFSVLFRTHLSIPNLA